MRKLYTSLHNYKLVLKFILITICCVCLYNFVSSSTAYAQTLNQVQAEQLLEHITGLKEAEIAEHQQWINLIMGESIDNSDYKDLCAAINSNSEITNIVNYGDVYNSLVGAIDVGNKIEAIECIDKIIFLKEAYEDIMDQDFTKLAKLAAWTYFSSLLSDSIPCIGFGLTIGQITGQYFENAVNQAALVYYYNNYYSQLRGPDFSEAEVVELFHPSQFDLSPDQEKILEDNEVTMCECIYQIKLQQQQSISLLTNEINQLPQTPLPTATPESTPTPSPTPTPTPILSVTIKEDDSLKSDILPYTIKYDSQIINNESNSTLEYIWYIDNKEVSRNKSFEYTFGIHDKGNHNIQVNVIEKAEDGTSQEADDSIITDIESSYSAYFISNPPTSSPGLNIEFDASSSQLSSNITKYHWDFGDGTTLDATSPIVNHEYLTARPEDQPYTVKLSIYSNDRLADEYSNNIKIGNFGPTIFDEGDQEFYSSYSPYISNVDVHLKNKSIHLYPGTVVNLNKNLFLTGGSITLDTDSIITTNSVNIDCGINKENNPVNMNIFGKGTIVINGDLTILSGNLNLDSVNLIVKGNLIQSGGTINLGRGALNIYGKMNVNGGNIDLYQGSINVTGNLIQAGGTINVNQGTLNISRDYRLQTQNSDGTYTAYSAGALQMTKDEGTLMINGSFIYSRLRIYNDNNLTAGTIELAGDFTQTYNDNVNIYYINGFLASGTNKVILTGNKFQTIDMNYDLYGGNFNILTIANTSNEGVNFKSYAKVIGTLSRKNDSPIGNPKDVMISRNTDIDPSNWKEDIGIVDGWTPKNDEIFEKDVYLYSGNLTLSGKNIQVNGSLYANYYLSYPQSNIHFNNETLIIKGDLKQNTCNIDLGEGNLNIYGKMYVNGGNIDLNQGTINVTGNLIQAGGTINVNQGTLNISGDYRIQTEKVDGSYGNYSDGSLQMTKDKGTIIISGSFTNSECSYHNNTELNAGTIKLAGDFTDSFDSSSDFYSDYFVANGTNKLILTGDKLQNINMCQDLSSKHGHFNDLIISNTGEGIKFKYFTEAIGKILRTTETPIYNASFLTISGNADIDGSNWKEDIGIGDGWTATRDEIFEKDVYIYSGNVYLNGKSIQVNGDLNVGRLFTNIIFNNETLTIKGDLDLINNYGQISLNHGTLNIYGDINLAGGFVDLGQGIINAAGDLIQSGGIVNIEEGTFTINKDYRIQTKDYDGTFINFSNGKLYMMKDKGTLVINGSFINSGSTSYGSDAFNAGTIKLAGDFIESFGNLINCNYFEASETNNVILIGEGLQKIYLGRPGVNGSRFNILEIKNTSKEGVVFETPVVVLKLFDHHQNKFTLEYTSEFPDYDGDGLKDNVDPYPTEVTDAGNLTNGDLDGDNIVSDKDAIIIKDYLLGIKTIDPDIIITKGDLDGDKKITSRDYALFLKLIRKIN